MRYFFISFLFLFSSYSFSASYIWTTQSSPFLTSNSPSDLCELISTYYTDQGFTLTTPLSITISTSTQRYCAFQYKRPDNRGYAVHQPMFLTGDSCPSPSAILDSDTGVCLEPNLPDPPKDCSEHLGTTGYHLSPTGLSRPDPSSPFPPSGTVSPTLKSMCSSGCQYKYAGDGSTVSCGSLNGGDPLIHFCVFSYKGTGSPCDTGDSPPPQSPIPDVPPVDPLDPTDPANNCGKNHVWSGTTCVSKFDPDSTTNPTDNTSGGGSGGSGGGDGDGGGDGGDGDGGDGGNGDGGGGGGEPGEGGDGGQGLEIGTLGSFDEGISEWEDKIENARTDLDQKIAQYSSLFEGVFDLNLGSGGGSLPCETFPISFGNTSTSLSICLSDYQDELSYLRYIVLLAAAVFAAFIVLR